MASIRTRLTATYAAALIGTVVVFAATLWTGRRASGYRELQRYVVSQAEVATQLIQVPSGPGRQLTQASDSLVGPLVVASLRVLLDALPDYLIVTDTAGRVVYQSEAVLRLVPGEVDEIVRAATASQASLAATTFPVRRLVTRGGREETVDDELLVARQRVRPSEAPLALVIFGASTSASVQTQRELFGSMLAIAPFVLLVSIGVAYNIAGRAFRPVDQLINEVEAITDGRSLHRRLAVDSAGDELARLGATLNEMIGRLETSFAGLRRFTADASHELKTPLTVLRADVERAMSASTTQTDQLIALEEALQETTRMANLVDSLLTLARADEGRFDLHRELVELEPLVREVCETAVILGEDAGLSIDASAIEPATVLGDPTRLRHLFLNLVTNAIKYTPRGGHVEIRLQRQEHEVAFSVRDTGIGISAADLPYIFERFWRADRVRSRRVSGVDGTLERGGFGLGLAISQWIAHAHGGTLSVVSRLTRGSTFTVLLPLPTPAEIEVVARV
jgi:two-component system OmpR family sensor kinase